MKYQLSVIRIRKEYKSKVLTYVGLWLRYFLHLCMLVYQFLITVGLILGMSLTFCHFFCPETTDLHDFRKQHLNRASDLIKCSLHIYHSRDNRYFRPHKPQTSCQLKAEFFSHLPLKLIVSKCKLAFFIYLSERQTSYYHIVFIFLTI